MAVDVRTEIVIQRPRQEVAAFAGDPENAPAWYENILAVERQTPGSLAVGSRFGFVTKLLGRRLVYTYEVKELVPGWRFVMRTEDGPYPMETTYLWEDADDGTRMILINRGRPKGFSRVGTPLVEKAMRKANTKDLERLKALLEGTTDPS